MLAPPLPALELAAIPDQSARWSDAYQLWLASRRSSSTRRAYRAAWDSLIAHTAKAPWEISRADVAASNFERFPPMLPAQPIFYQELTFDYAVQISRDWNTHDLTSDYAGFVLQFEVDDDYA